MSNYNYFPTIIPVPDSPPTADNCLEHKLKQRDQSLIDSLSESKIISPSMARIITEGKKLQHCTVEKLFRTLNAINSFNFKILASSQMFDDNTLFDILTTVPEEVHSKFLFYWVYEELPVYEKDYRSLLHIIKRGNTNMHRNPNHPSIMHVMRDLYAIQDRINTRGFIYEDPKH